MSRRADDFRAPPHVAGDRVDERNSGRAVAENNVEGTESGPSPGSERPVVIPLLIVPMARMPVSAGASVTIAPGTAVNVLFGVVDE